MRQELTEKLAEIPLVRRSLNHPKSRLSEVGIECGDGWFYLVRELMTTIQGQHQNLLWVVRIREAAGELRVHMEGFFYYKNRGLANKIDDMVREAREKSHHICESCGDPGKRLPRLNGVYKTLCERCAEAAEIPSQAQGAP